MSAFYTPKELEVGVASDDTNVGTAASSGWKAIEVETVAMPTFSDVKIERKAGSGSGIMVSETDMWRYGKGATIEGSLSGYLTDTLMNLFMPCVLSQAWDTSGDPAKVINVATTSSSNKMFAHAATNPTTLSFAYNGIGGSLEDCVIFSGCVITSFSMNADPNEDGGRMKFDLTWVTRTPKAIGSTFGTSAASLTAFAATDYVFLGDYKTHTKIDNTAVMLKSFAMTIENPVTFLGMGGNAAEGTPQQYVRSLPEMNITVNPIIKYDGDVDHLWDDFRGSGEGAQTATLAAPAFEMSNHATYSSGDCTRAII